LPAFAASQKLGSQCGLIDSYDEFGAIDATKTLSLGKFSEEEVAALPTLSKQQIIIAAKEANRFADQDIAITNTSEAAKFLRDWSEGGEVYVKYMTFQGERYTQVVFYPGGNAAGMVFETGSRHAVATISDSDLICK